MQANGATGLRRGDSYIMQTFTLMGGTLLVSSVYIKGGGGGVRVQLSWGNIFLPTPAADRVMNLYKAHCK